MNDHHIPQSHESTHTIFNQNECIKIAKWAVQVAPAESSEKKVLTEWRKRCEKVTRYEVLAHAHIARQTTQHYA